MAERFPYPDARAFRNALKDRFAVLASSDATYRVPELQRQFAYDRALARIFTPPDDERWVLKGASALLARLPGARHSKDVDIAYAAEAARSDLATNALRSALDRDLGDHFRFEISRIAPLHEEAKGSRVHLHSALGPTIFASFHVDVVVVTTMTGTPDLVPPLTPLQVPGLVRPPYRAFPIVDHLADKFCAIADRYGDGESARPSSRVKDLVDIGLIATTQAVGGAALRVALVTNAADRALHLPSRFGVPHHEVWERGYARIAATAPGALPRFDEALGIAATLFNPVLVDEVPDCAWDPVQRAWVGLSLKVGD